MPVSDMLAFVVLILIVGTVPLMMLTGYLIMQLRDQTREQAKDAMELIRVAMTQRFAQSGQEAADIVECNRPDDSADADLVIEQSLAHKHTGDFSVGSTDFSVCRDELGFLDRLDDDGSLIQEDENVS